MADIHEECGVFGIYAPGENVANLTYFGILAQQHRGQESSGIATSNGVGINVEKQAGRVDRFTEDQISRLRGGDPQSFMAIGHNRYSNTGSNIYENYQPFVIETVFGPLALAHNGNLVNPDQIAKRLKDAGIEPKGSSDSELIALLIALECKSQPNFEKAIAIAAKCLIGSFSLVIMTRDQLIGLRDPWGIRPLSLGRLNGSHYLLASETCAFEALGAKFVQDVKPGEMVVVSNNAEPICCQELTQVCNKLCIFCFIYFASPGSILYDRLLQTARRHMGESLWVEHPVIIDDPHKWIVCGVPNTGGPAAKGFADASGLEERTGFIKNPYVGRTFIQPDQRLRELGVRSKLQVLPREVMRKKVVVVEDSVVRATTSLQIVQALREAGAEEVHFRVTSPPYKYRCYMGVDTQYSKDLIAAEKSVEEIRRHIDADSLGYLSLGGVIGAINKEKYAQPIPPDCFCSACFDNNYPFPIPDEQGRFVL